MYCGAEPLSGTVSTIGLASHSHCKWKPQSGTARTVVLSGRLPNTFPEVASKHNLETSIIKTAPFLAIFWEVFLIFWKRQGAPFRM
jgi:hypothetical protein